MTLNRQLLVPLAAAAIVGAVLPAVGAGSAGAQVASVPPPAAEAGFSGYSAQAFATPMRVEIFEPTIPIPATPQAEVYFGYSTVEADSSTSAGRASYLWPGDPVGEGFKTIVEAVGLPPEIGENGYPLQVNSKHPAGPDFEADEQFPGLIMRTGAAEGETYAENSYSPDNAAQDSDDEGDEGDEGGAPGFPGVPGLPSLLGGAAAPGEPSGAPGIPPELAAIADFGGYTSVSKTTNSDELALATSRASLTDVTLLGGVITIDSIKTKAISKSDGAKGDNAGTAQYGILTVAGQKFSFGPNGFEAAGQVSPIPGLPDNAAKALDQLGVKLIVPKPVYETEGDKATAEVAALIVDIDTTVLRKQLAGLPLNDIVNQLPDETGELKTLLGAAVNLAPRFVVTLGVAASEVDTVQGIDQPPVDPEEPEEPEEPAEPEEEPAEEGDGSGGGSAGGGLPGAGSAGGGTPPTAGTPGTSGAPAATGSETIATSPVGAQLPGLFSIPNLLLIGALVGATLLGSYMRRLGAAALGGGASCPHGLDSGLPDLRKA